MTSDMDERSKKILSRLEARCSKCEYCSSDIYRKALEALKREAGPEADMEELREAADGILSSLVTDRFVDDLRYATAFAREKSSITGWGKVKIRFALAAKKIPESVIGEALGEIDEGASGDRLVKMLAAKWKTLSAPDGKPLQDAKLKLIRFALTRGYEYEDVRSAVESVIRDGQS